MSTTETATTGSGPSGSMTSGTAQTGANGGATSGAGSGSVSGGTGADTGASTGADGGASTLTEGGACGLPPTPSGAANPSCVLATPAPPTVPINAAQSLDEAKAGVLAWELEFLDQAIGKYLRGDARVYVGTASAHDNPNAPGLAYAGLGYAAGLLPATDVVASLTYFVDATGKPIANLEVFAACEPEHLTFQQDTAVPNVTQATPIEDTGTFGGIGDASCDGCAPGFLDAPSTIAWNDAAFTSPLSASFQMRATLSLRDLTPCSLTWDLLATLDGLRARDYGVDALDSLEHYERVGNEMVFKDNGTFPGIGLAKGQCQPLVGYTVERFVDLSNLANYGVRNLMTTPTGQQVCGN